LIARNTNMRQNTNSYSRSTIRPSGLLPYIINFWIYRLKSLWTSGRSPWTGSQPKTSTHIKSTDRKHKKHAHTISFQVTIQPQAQCRSGRNRMCHWLYGHSNRPPKYLRNKINSPL